MGPGFPPILYSSLCSHDSASLRRQNLGKIFWGPPLDQILDPLVDKVDNIAIKDFLISFKRGEGIDLIVTEGIDLIVSGC